MPHIYSAQFLEMCDAIEANGTVILNPRDLDQRSMFLVDMDFRHDLGTHRAWKRHRKDVRKWAKGK